MLDVKGLAKFVGDEAKDGIRIQKQIALPWRDAFRISIRNVTLRLGRAAITVSGIVLGIAFLSSIWTKGVIETGLEQSRIQHEQELVEATARVDSSEQDAGAVVGTTEEQKRARASRQLWLVVMSLLVCGVGITNAMLMSVTERFQEIGTMKCLGALDNFIVRLFLIESALLGLLGSVVGTLLGHLAMLGSFSISERSLSVAAKMDWSQMLIYLVISVLVGAVLSLIAAIAPAMRAARMRPAVALQSEI